MATPTPPLTITDVDEHLSKKYAVLTKEAFIAYRRATIAFGGVIAAILGFGIWTAAKLAVTKATELETTRASIAAISAMEKQAIQDTNLIHESIPNYTIADIGPNYMILSQHGTEDSTLLCWDKVPLDTDPKDSGNRTFDITFPKAFSDVPSVSHSAFINPKHDHFDSAFVPFNLVDKTANGFRGRLMNARAEHAELGLEHVKAVKCPDQVTMEYLAIGKCKKPKEEGK